MNEMAGKIGVIEGTVKEMNNRQKESHQDIKDMKKCITDIKVTCGVRGEKIENLKDELHTHRKDQEIHQTVPQLTMKVIGLLSTLTVIIVAIIAIANW